MRHVFEVTVDGVRGLSVFSNTVWGEADCFVQYHFPTTGERDKEEGEKAGIVVPRLQYRGTLLFI